MKDRIKAVRNELKLTQTEFAERIGISRSALTKLEAGISDPAERTIMLIAREFRVDEDWLRNGVGEMFMPKTQRQEMAEWIAEVDRMPSSSAQKRIMHLLAMLDPDDWNAIAKMIRIIKEEE